MGCWNATCAVSHLPIREGEKVRGYILIPADFSYKHLKAADKMAQGGFCYPSDVFYPLSFGVKGEYNDYGSMDDIQEDVNTRGMVAWVNELISKNQVQIEAEDSSDSKPKYVKSIENMEEFIGLVERGCTPFAFCMILESMVTTLIKAIEEDEGYDTKNWKMEKSLKELELMASHHKLQMENVAKAENPKLAELMASFDSRHSVPGVDGKRGSNYISRILGDSASNPAFHHMYSIDTLLPLIYKANKKVVTAVAEHVQIHRAFMLTRRAWVPQCGAGSQTEEYRMHRMIAEASLAHINGKFKEHMKDINQNDADEVAYAKKQY